MYAGDEQLLPLVGEAGMTLELCARAVLGLWPEAVIQDAQNAEIFPNFGSIPFFRMLEMMIYRDQKAFQSWEELGADESNRNTMAHFLVSKSAARSVSNLVMVLDDASSVEAVRLLQVVTSVLHSHDELVQLYGRGKAA